MDVVWLAALRRSLRGHRLVWRYGHDDRGGEHFWTKPNFANRRGFFVDGTKHHVCTELEFNGSDYFFQWNDFRRSDVQWNEFKWSNFSWRKLESNIRRGHGE